MDEERESFNAQDEERESLNPNAAAGSGEGSHGGMFVLNFVVVSSIASLAPPA